VFKIVIDPKEEMLVTKNERNTKELVYITAEPPPYRQYQTVAKTLEF
jgi:hypothetical protein